MYDKDTAREAKNLVLDGGECDCPDDGSDGSELKPWRWTDHGGLRPTGDQPRRHGLTRGVLGRGVGAPPPATPPCLKRRVFRVALFPLRKHCKQMRHFSWTRSCPSLLLPALFASQARTNLLDAPPSVASLSRVPASPHRASPAWPSHPRLPFYSLPLAGWLALVPWAGGKVGFGDSPLHFTGGALLKLNGSRDPTVLSSPSTASVRPPA